MVFFLYSFGPSVLDYKSGHKDPAYRTPFSFFFVVVYVEVAFIANEKPKKYYIGRGHINKYMDIATTRPTWSREAEFLKIMAK